MHIHSSNPVKYGQMRSQLLPHVSAPEVSPFRWRTQNVQHTAEIACRLKPWQAMRDFWRRPQILPLVSRDATIYSQF
jgi:hypothetical protein